MLCVSFDTVLFMRKFLPYNSLLILQNVKPLPEHYAQALKTAYDRYSKYLDSFGPDEFYLKKKVESELGRRMIHLKMRCGGLNSEWGKVQNLLILMLLIFEGLHRMSYFVVCIP